MKKLILSLLLALSIASPALAQGSGASAGTWTRVAQTWFPQARAALTATVTTSNVAIGAGATAKVCNTGAADAYIQFGVANTQVATVAGSFLLPASGCEAFDMKPFNTLQTYLAGITATGTANLAITTGLGSPSLASVSSSAGAPVVVSDPVLQGLISQYALTPPLAITGMPTLARNATLTTANTAQQITQINATINGFEVCNPDPSEVMWVSDTVTAVAGGSGSYGLGPSATTVSTNTNPLPNCYRTPLGSRPAGILNFIAVTIGHKLTGKSW